MIPAVPWQTLGNRVLLSEKGWLDGADADPVLPEQMELARLEIERASLGRATAAPDRSCI